MTFSTNLFPDEIERLALLLEECGEVQQAIGKVLRHGYFSCHPVTRETNIVALEREIGDLLYVIDMLLAKDLVPDEVENHKIQKGQRITPFLHYQTPETRDGGQMPDTEVS